MEELLDVLIIEDSEADYHLIERHLKKNGLAVACRRVSDLEELAAALADRPWALILADYNLPQLRFEDGLALIRAKRPDLPIILISGSVGEEKAVELLKLGVWDFVLKANLTRLVPAITRNLREAAEHQARRLTERALRESEERLRQTLGAAEVVAWELNLATGEIRESGPVGLLFGRTGTFHHLNNEAFIASVHPEDRERLALSHTRPGIATDTFTDEFRIIHPDGSVHWLMSNGSVVRDDAGQPSRVLGIARDITRRKLAEEAALRANSALLRASRLSVLGQVATTIAHEVNQPVGAAKNYLQVARCRVTDPALLEILDKVDAQLTRTAATVRKVREFAAHRALELRPETVRSLVDEACALGLLDAGPRAVTVSLSIPDTLPKVVVDRVQIQQVLINLVRNAVEALEGMACRHIHISAALAAATIEIAVADTGPGLAEAVRPRLFTAFTTTKPNGTGLGLSTSRSIAEAHGGRLVAEDRPGGGTVVRLVLPHEESVHG
ncbi:MAG: ATP-binding protein [Rhodospirillaceae bacterium]